MLYYCVTLGQPNCRVHLLAVPPEFVQNPHKAFRTMDGILNSFSVVLNSKPIRVQDSFISISSEGINDLFCFCLQMHTKEEKSLNFFLNWSRIVKLFIKVCQMSLMLEALGKDKEYNNILATFSRSNCYFFQRSQCINCRFPLQMCIEKMTKFKLLLCLVVVRHSQTCLDLAKVMNDAQMLTEG